MKKYSKVDLSRCSTLLTVEDSAAFSVTSSAVTSSAASPDACSSSEASSAVASWAAVSLAVSFLVVMVWNSESVSWTVFFFFDVWVVVWNSKSVGWTVLFFWDVWLVVWNSEPVSWTIFFFWARVWDGSSQSNKSNENNQFHFDNCKLILSPMYSA